MWNLKNSRVNFVHKYIKFLNFTYWCLSDKKETRQEWKESHIFKEDYLEWRMA